MLTKGEWILSKSSPGSFGSWLQSDKMEVILVCSASAGGAMCHLCLMGVALSLNTDGHNLCVVF